MDTFSMVLGGKTSLASVYYFVLTLIFCLTAAGMAASDDAYVLRTALSDTPWNGSARTNGAKVIYGADDRIDVYEEDDPARLSWAAATCALVSAADLTYVGGGYYDLSVYAYQVSGRPPCDGEPFAEQPTAAFCSAFMAGPDIIVTAGHCVSEANLPNIRFLFGFDMVDATTPILQFHEDQIYTGEALLSYVSSGARDHAVVRVDRLIVAPEARSLPVRRDNVVSAGTNVGVIGHPWGLPKKIAFGEDTIVRENGTTEYFIANLDTFGGNSGSPVFNATTGVVEGILVRGAQDFVVENACFRSNVYSSTGGPGEDVTRTTVFAFAIPDMFAEGEHEEGEGEPEEGELGEGEGEPEEGELGEGEGEPEEGELGEGEGEPEEGEGELEEGETLEGEDVWERIPNLVNLLPSTSESLLTSQGFALGSVSETYHEIIARGRIVSHSPTAGTPAPPATVVSIVVSRGTSTVLTPNLLGQTVERAAAVLETGGLQLGAVSEMYHSEAQLGSIVSQSPAAGTDVMRNSTVDIVASKGPEPVPEEGEAPPDDDGFQGCCRSQDETKGLATTIRRVISDWLLIGLALLTVASMSALKIRE